MTDAPKRIWIDPTRVIMGHTDQPHEVTPRDVEYVRADLASPTPTLADALALPAVQVGVKPLEWVDFSDRGAKAMAWNDANYMIQKWSDGRWEISASYPGYSTSLYGVDRFHSTLEAAKAAAQADYEARILSALEPAPEVAALVEAMPTTAAERDVLTERSRQCVVEGWTPAHDDKHVGAEMSTAAACYALSASGWGRTALWEIWPKSWGVDWFRPNHTNPRRDLVKAGALIIAEIERIDRAALSRIAPTGGKGE